MGRSDAAFEGKRMNVGRNAILPGGGPGSDPVRPVKRRVFAAGASGAPERFYAVILGLTFLIGVKLTYDAVLTLA
jgi:hypothetical protein